MGLVTNIMTVIDQSVMNTGERFFSATAAGMTPIMTMATTILLILVGMNHAVGYYRMSGRDSIQLAVRICLIYVFAFSWSNFGTFYDAFSTASGDLAMTFFDVAASTGETSTYAAMDNFAVNMADTADGVARAQGSIMRGVLGAIFFLALSLLMAIYVLVVGFAKIMIAFLLGVAPLAIVATLFERTKNLFEAWLTSFVGYLLYPIAASAIIATIVAVAREQFVDQSDTDTISQTLGFLVVVIVGIFALKAIPQAAQHITGHFQLANIVPDALRLTHLGVVNAPGANSLRSRAQNLRTMVQGFSNGPGDPKQVAEERNRSLRERGASMRQKLADRRLIRGQS